MRLHHRETGFADGKLGTDFERRNLSFLVLCQNCIRYHAYREALLYHRPTAYAMSFWAAILNNFKYMFFIEWYALFGSDSSQPWIKVIKTEKHALFKNEMLSKLNLKKKDFRAYVEQVARFRNNSAAHVPDYNDPDMPDFQIALDSVMFLYDFLLKEGNFPPHTRIEINPCADKLYQISKTEAFESLINEKGT